MSEKLIKIRVSESAHKAIKKVADANDMKEIGVASRVYEWFGNLEPSVQNWILGFVEAATAEDIERIVARMASSRSKGK